MLQLTNIRKSYTTGNFTQVALNDVSVSFRDNEFVAILGPSGSGKTTLLNIIGGLDHYDSGDHTVDGISTKQYKDRDWDTYRNNRIGFVFQSYNLIPHLTVLANVELALTLSGVPRTERKSRAVQALEKVGLADHINKKPSQLSGGQMQRVAIARALINDPEILLADEPTGALDSKTSVQIMDLLTEIARDRLVIMVTHNPELADQYATRTVNLSDGVIRNDTNPFFPTTDEMRLSTKTVRRTSMSFLTALSLSARNLMTKKGRTIMTAFAGSIGIIGIAAILALANGVNNYIASVEEETLSAYPLQITSSGFDMSSLLSMSVGVEYEDSSDSSDDADGSGTDGSGSSGTTHGGRKSDTIGEMKILTSMFSSVTSNDLASLKEYLESDECDIDSYVSSIEYSYDVTPQIYDADTSKGVRQINPDSSFSSLGLSSLSSTSSLSSLMSTSGTDIFDVMPSDTSTIEDQYEVLAGHWPESYNECVLVLTSTGDISDFASYVLGFRDSDQLQDMIKQILNGEEIDEDFEDIEITYDDILSLEMKLVCAADYYAYDEEYEVWVDKTGDDAYMTDLVNNAEDIVISGIVKAKPDATVTTLTLGIYYTPELTEYLIDEAAKRQIVQDQIDNPTIDVFSGTPFAELDDSDSGLDFSSMITIDSDAIANAFTIDTSALSLDMSSIAGDMDLSEMDLSDADINIPDMDTSSLNLDDAITMNEEVLIEATAAITADYLANINDIIAANPDVDFTDQETLLGLYLESESAQILMATYLPQLFDTSGLESSLEVYSAYMASYMTQVIAEVMSSYMTQVMSAMSSQIESSLTSAFSQLSENMSSAMGIDSDAFAEAFQMNMDTDQLTEIIMSMMSTDETTYDSNLSSLGYADLNNPSEIDIYPLNFECKQNVVDILDEYNEKMEAAGEEEKEITYTDIVGTLMSSVTTIVNMISYVLIAFVAISLIVSSIMIGVITYISVLERRKEIGILRAIGASKGDISNVFNAETVIEGLVSGVLGVGLTALACIPACAIVYALFDVPNIAILPWKAACILVAISVVLTFVAGLIPASSASRKDPVEALRSE